MTKKFQLNLLHEAKAGNIVCREYEIVDSIYRFDVKFDGDRTELMSVYKNINDKYTPEIYFKSMTFDGHVNEFKIQTTAFGALMPSEIQFVIDGYNHALAVVEFLKNEFVK